MPKFSKEQILRDPCDEPARELRIRALLASGERALACRELRAYRETLRLELGTEPSPEIGALIG
jgi:DNA-binding SARP family transcriptional activator